MPPQVIRAHDLPLAELDPLRHAARAESFRAVERLVDEWTDGRNRFHAAGEALFLVREPPGRLIGIGGLNRDIEPGAGRVRRLFVLPDHRRAGTGRTLMAAIERHAVGTFEELGLRTTDARADAFYCSLGYSRVEEENRTHRKRLGG